MLLFKTAAYRTTPEWLCKKSPAFLWRATAARFSACYPFAQCGQWSCNEGTTPTWYTPRVTKATQIRASGPSLSSSTRQSKWARWAGQRVSGRTAMTREGGGAFVTRTRDMLRSANVSRTEGRGSVDGATELRGNREQVDLVGTWLVVCSVMVGNQYELILWSASGR